MQHKDFSHISTKPKENLLLQLLSSVNFFQDGTKFEIDSGSLNRPDLQ